MQWPKPCSIPEFPQPDSPEGAVSQDMPPPFREATLEATWAAICPHLAGWGITRLADLTGLDVIGVPVWSGIRPAASTVAVSAGKGLTSLAAKISAAMEAIEVAVAEAYLPKQTVTDTPQALGLSYDVTRLPLHDMSLVTPRTTLEFVSALSLARGVSTLIPTDAVGLRGWCTGEWTPRTFLRSTNGLASGNTIEEAVLHALLELIERDALAKASLVHPDDRVFVRLDSVESAEIQALLVKIRSAGLQVAVHVLPAIGNLSAFWAEIWDQYSGQTYAGSGAHLAPEMALSRALTEAVQSRLSVIAGARDDIPSHIYDSPPRRRDLKTERRDTRLSSERSETSTTVADALQEVIEVVTQHTGQDVMVIDLSPDQHSVNVVQTFAPGLAFAPTRVIGPSAVTSRAAS